MKRRRLHKKDDYLGLRLPKTDKDELELAARKVLRDPSDLAWVLIKAGVTQILQSPSTPTQALTT